MYQLVPAGRDVQPKHVGVVSAKVVNDSIDFLGRCAASFEDSACQLIYTLIKLVRDITHSGWGPLRSRFRVSNLVNQVAAKFRIINNIVVVLHQQINRRPNKRCSGWCEHSIIELGFMPDSHIIALGSIRSFQTKDVRSAYEIHSEGHILFRKERLPVRQIEPF